MAATWHHWFGMIKRDSELKWYLKFAWLPKRSKQSGQRIWFKKAWYGTRLIWGLAGEDPVREEQWLTEDEYTWYCLTNA